MALPMNASTVQSVAAATGLDLPDDVLFVLDENPDLTGSGYAGHTWPDGRRVTLYENDALIWPHCDGLNWPHLRPIVA